MIKRALIEKQSLVADILNIPKEDFEHVADMASEASGLEKEPTELILAAISQGDTILFHSVQFQLFSPIRNSLKKNNNNNKQERMKDSENSVLVPSIN